MTKSVKSSGLPAWELIKLALPVVADVPEKQFEMF